jgi:hypothetical protein
VNTLEREIKTTTIDNEVVKYRELSSLQAFELINIFEDFFYTDKELPKILKLDIDERLDRFRVLLTSIYKTNDATPDLQLLLNKASRERLITLLNSLYVDVDVTKVSNKAFLKLFSFLSEQLTNINVDSFLQ